MGDQNKKLVIFTLSFLLLMILGCDDRQAASKNTDQNSVLNYQKDTVPPTVTVTAPVSGSTTKGNITLTAMATDNIEVSGVQFYIDGAPIATEISNAPFSLSLNTFTLTNASHFISAQARDTSGNKSMSNRVSFIVNNSRSGAISVSMNRTSILEGEAVTVDFSRSSGGDSCTIDYQVDANSGDLLGASEGMVTMDSTSLKSRLDLPFANRSGVQGVRNVVFSIVSVSSRCTIDSAHRTFEFTLNDRPTLETDLFLNPFNKQSAHHRPIGTGAVYGILQGEVRTRGRLNIITDVNIGVPRTTKYLYQVQTSDPIELIEGSGEGLPVSLKIPEDIDLPPDRIGGIGDNNVMFYPRNGLAADILDLFFGFQSDRSGFTASRHVSYGIRGSDVGGGTSASRLKWPSSTLRGFEILSGKPIRHALNVAVSRLGAPTQYQILSKTYRWPATGTDGSSGDPQQNLGDIPYGTRCAIRPQDAGKRETLGLSPLGKVLFDAHLYYGVLVLDGTGTLPGGARWHYRTDQDIPAAQRNLIVTELRKIVPLLWPIDNTRENEEFAGGGTSLGGINTAWDDP